MKPIESGLVGGLYSIPVASIITHIVRHSNANSSEIEYDFCNGLKPPPIYGIPPGFDWHLF